MSGRPFDRVSLAAGLGIGALGVLLMLDDQDVIALGFGWLGAATAAVLGTILLVTGLEEARQARPRSSPESRSEP
jgi:hypothetical protein